MKKLLTASLIAAGLVTSTANAAVANLTVNATVQSKCTITTSPSTAAVTVDPTLAGPYTASSSFGYKCTKNVTPATFTAGAGLNFSGSNRLSDGTNFLNYTATMPSASTGLGFGAAAEITASISVSISTTDGQAAAASSTYADTVVITVNP